MKFKPYSFSKINSFLTCPRQFQYKYVLKLPVQVQDRLPLIKGSALHNILEKYPGEPTAARAPEFRSCLNNFLSSKYVSLFSMPNIRELSFGLCENLTPVDYSNKALLRGYMDFIGFHNDTLVICDWKSGKYKDEKYQDFSQLIFYAIYMFKKYSKIHTIKIMFVYIEHVMDNSLILTRDNLEQYESQLLSVINNIEASDFPKNISILCDYCDFQDHCVRTV